MNEEKVKRAIELMKLGKSFGLEAKELLSEEAVKKGFVLGATFDSPFTSEEGRYKITEKGFYLTDKGEFNVGGKCGITIYHNGEWAEIVKDIELVDGEIYVRNNWIIRHGFTKLNTNNNHFQAEPFYYVNDKIDNKPATPKKKKKLIKAEVKNGYFHELNKK